MRRQDWFWGLVIAALVCQSAAAAERTRWHDLADSSRYWEKAEGMLVRGLLNVGTGFVDVLTQTINESKVPPPVLSTARGLTYGLGCGVLRTASGALDLVAFWVPAFHGAPVSASYTNCLDVGP